LFCFEPTSNIAVIGANKYSKTRHFELTFWKYLTLCLFIKLWLSILFPLTGITATNRVLFNKPKNSWIRFKTRHRYYEIDVNLIYIYVWKLNQTVLELDRWATHLLESLCFPGIFFFQIVSSSFVLYCFNFILIVALLETLFVGVLTFKIFPMALWYLQTFIISYWWRLLQSMTQFSSNTLIFKFTQK
jgi:hypothetical protein